MFSQTRDLPLHKSECAGLANYRQHIAHYPPEIIEPARLLIRLLEKTAANRSSKVSVAQHNQGFS